jgi:hypothetical protein
VEQLYVRPDLLRRGIGSALLHEPRSGCRRGSGCGSFSRTLRRGASTSATGSGSSRRPMAAGTRNGRRMPSTSGGPPTRSRGPRTAAAWPGESGPFFAKESTIAAVSSPTTTTAVTSSVSIRGTSAREMAQRWRISLRRWALHCRRSFTGFGAATIQRNRAVLKAALDNVARASLWATGRTVSPALHGGARL